MEKMGKEDQALLEDIEKSLQKHMQSRVGKIQAVTIIVSGEEADATLARIPPGDVVKVIGLFELAKIQLTSALSDTPRKGGGDFTDKLHSMIAQLEKDHANPTNN